MMKKRLLPILLLVLIASCSQEHFSRVSPSLSDVSLKSDNSITLDDIHEYLSGYKNIKDTKSASVSVESILEGTDTVMYLINYQDGWELLSADRRAPRVFAMSDEGNTTIEKLTDIPALNTLYQRFVESISYLKRNPDIPSSNDFDDSWDEVLGPRALWTLISTTVIAEGDSVQNHLTSTLWGQTSPWNICAPYGNSAMTYHCKTGCGPVAIAQMLYYLHQKEGIPYSAYEDCYTEQYVPDPIQPGVEEPLILQLSDITFFSPSSANWNNMALSMIDTTKSFATVSALMVQVGALLPARYYAYHTSSLANCIAPVFQQNFSINCTGQNNVDMDIIADQIYSAQMPVLLCISANSGQTGHALIVDAFKYHYQVLEKVYRVPKPDPFIDPWLRGGGNLIDMYDYITVYETVVSNRYVGMNWGNGGVYPDSSWFSADVINWPMGYVYNALDYMVYGFCQ